jgi:hypothetical protein
MTNLPNTSLVSPVSLISSSYHIYSSGNTNLIDWAETERPGWGQLLKDVFKSSIFYSFYVLFRAPVD